MSTHTPDSYRLAKSKEDQVSIGRETAIELAQSGWWEGKTAREAVGFQLSTTELSMPFEKFHQLTEEALGRPVWTHEFAFFQSLMDEFHGTTPKPTMGDVLDKIPDGKPIILVATPDPQ